MAKPETVKNLKEADKCVKTLEKENQKLQPVFKQISSGLESAIKDSNFPMIKLYQPKLEKTVEAVNNAVHRAEGCLALIGFVQQDEEFIAKCFNVIENLLKKVTGIQQQLTDQLTQARDIDRRAAEALDNQQGNKEDAIRELAVLEDQVVGLKKTADYIATETPKLEAAAKKAFAAGNAKALTDARMKLIDLGKAGPAVHGLRSKVNAFLKKYPDQDRQLKAEANWLLDDLTRIEDIYADLSKLIKELIQLGQPQKAEAKDTSIDVDKAADLLGIASRDQARLAKVLEGSPNAMEKSLDTLCKTLKLEIESGKAALAVLKKNKIV
jgi:hypothetical protein